MAPQDLQPPPLTDAKQLSLSWKQVAQRAATGVKAVFGDDYHHVSVDIPQISSVDHSTLLSLCLIPIKMNMSVDGVNDASLLS